MFCFIGIIVGISGLIIAIVDWIYPHKFSTILEIDFDTPYDRHIIIEESLDTGKRKFKIPRLEEPLNVGRNVGSRLLRRLSKRGNETTIEEVHTNPGLDNPGFEMDLSSLPKTPWKSSVMRRVDSKKSNKSVIFRNKASGLFEVSNLPEDKEEEDEKIGKNSLKKMVSKQKSLPEPESPVSKGLPLGDLEANSAPNLAHINRQDSQSSATSSTSSYGLGILSKDTSANRLHAEENNHEPVTRNNSGNIIVFHKTDSRGQLQRLVLKYK